MIVVMSVIKLVLKKDKFESSKSKEKANGGRGEEGKLENSNGNGGNGEPHNGKWKPKNKPKGPVRCFICDSYHMARVLEKLRFENDFLS